MVVVQKMKSSQVNFATDYYISWDGSDAAWLEFFHHRE